MTMLPETLACFVKMTRQYMETREGKAFTLHCFLLNMPHSTMLELSANRATGLRKGEQIYLIAFEIMHRNAAERAA